VTATVSSLGIVMRAAYRQRFEITNESCGSSFEEGQPSPQPRETKETIGRRHQIANPVRRVSLG
jgi:hypothetical protein